MVGREAVALDKLRTNPEEQKQQLLEEQSRNRRGRYVEGEFGRRRFEEKSR